MPTQPQTVDRTEALNGDDGNGDGQSLLEQGLSLLEQAQAAPSEDGQATSLFEQATEKLEQARAADADPLQVNIALARALLGLGRPDQARLSLRRAVAADESSDEAYRTMEEALTQLGSGDEWRMWADELDKRYNDEYALRAYQSAVAVNPEDVEARLGGGLLCSKQGRLESALDWYEQAAQRSRDPVQEVRAQVLAGGVLLELELHDDALHRLAAAIEFSLAPPGMTLENAEPFQEAFRPLIAWAHYLAGWARVGLGRYREALEDFERASRGQGGLPLFALQGAVAVLGRQGDYAAAWRRLAEVPDLDLNPGLLREQRPDLEYLDAYAGLLRAQGNWKQARRVYEKAGEHADDQAGVWLGLVMLNLDRRDEDLINSDEWYSRAGSLFERIRKQIKDRLRTKGELRDPDALRRRVSDLLTLGPLLVEMRHHEEAKWYLIEAIRISTDVGMGRDSLALAYAYLGLAQAGGGDYTHAAASLDEALNYDPVNLEYKVRLADVLTQLALFDRAERLYREVLERAPDNVDALIGLGEALTGLGDTQAEDSAGRTGAGDPDLYQDAREQFTRALKIAEETEPKVPVRLRTGSRSLNPRERAALHYAMGYGSVKLHQAGARKGRLLPRSLRPIARARKDFKRATESDRTHTQAARALRRLKDERGERAPRWGAFLLAGICVLLLLVVQADFYLKGKPNAIEKDAVTYAALTFGLLGFLLAALSLPELLKLRVGGVVIEKGRSEPSDVGTSLPISRGQSFTSRFSRRLAAVRSVRPDRAERRERRRTKEEVTRQGAKVDAIEGGKFPTPSSNGGPG